MMPLTIAEVLEALSQSVPQPDDEVPPNTYSGTEIREAMGVGYVHWKRAMQAWMLAGKVEVVQVRKRAMDGRLARTAAYRFIV